jgi:two-component system sensor kinase FixL
MDRSLPELALRLKAIIDTAIDGIITIDEKGLIESINPAAATLFGYQQEEIVGQNISILMPSPHRENHDAYISNYLRTGEAQIIGYGREVKALKKDGTQFPIRLAVSEVKGGERRLFTGIIHDLTDLKKVEREVKSLNQQLELKNNELEVKVDERTAKLAEAVNKMLEVNTKLKKEISEKEQIASTLLKKEQELITLLTKEKELSELKNRFVSMASHEFRTPLSTVLSSIELIEMYVQKERLDKTEKHINRVRTAVHHLTTILNDFLSLSRLEGGAIQLNSEQFSVKDFCDQVLGEIQNQLRPGQRVVHNSDVDDLFIYCDKNALRHIFYNLLSNASKYSNTDQTIYCIIQVSEAQLRIEVRDEGIGIPVEDQKYLFTRFFRANNVENIKGTGLGLNIVQQYVNLLQGKISFDSTPGKGTSFFVDIPLPNPPN